MLLFAITITILSQTYLSFIRLSHKISYSAAIQQDLRYVTEYTSRLVRNTPVDYSGTVGAVSSTLSLKPDGGVATKIKWANSNDPLCYYNYIRCLLVSTDGGGTWAPLTSVNINVDDFKVLVWPTSSPFVYDYGAGAYQSNQQPMVTIYLKMTYMATNVNERVTNDVQTTISSRVYAR